MKKGRLKRGVALLLSAMTLSMSVIPHLPPNILTAYAFHMTFNTSTSGDGHYDISGRVDGEKEETDFLCMKKGASAKSAYNYFKTNNDVNYSEGSLEHAYNNISTYLSFPKEIKDWDEFSDNVGVLTDNILSRLKVENKIYSIVNNFSKTSLG